MKLYTPKKKKKKIGRRILAITVLCLIVFSVFKLLSYSLNKFNNWPLLKIKKIEVVCSPPLKTQEVLLISELKEGTNIFSANTSIAKKKIMESPWVKKVKIHRSLPDTIKITVINRNVRLMVRKNNIVYYTDEKGEIIDKLIPGLRFDVPIVEVKDLNYPKAIKIIDRIVKSEWIGEHDISELLVTKDFIALYLTDYETKIYLNPRNLEHSIASTKKVIEDLETNGEKAFLIDASISDNKIFVRNIRKKTQ